MDTSSIERYGLTNKEYNELHKIQSEKRAVKELAESLKTQLATAIIQEDKWWKKMAAKHNLNTTNHMHSISHATQEIIGVPKKNVQESITQQTTAQTPAQDGIRVRERTPEMDKLVSPEELKAMRQARGENIQ